MGVNEITEKAREQIILAPGLNGSELLKSMALHGVNSFALRICNGVELARLALMHRGVPVEKKILGPRDEETMIAEAVNSIAKETADPADGDGSAGADSRGDTADETYFRDPSYDDFRQITAVIRRMRHLVAADNGQAEAEALERILDPAAGGISAKKNRALLSVYRLYIRELKDRNAIDSAGLIRFAAEKRGSLKLNIISLEEYPLSPLERMLAERLSANGEVHEQPLRALFFPDEKETRADDRINIQSCKNAYGAPNEVESIISDIYRENRLDRCTVAVSDIKTYSQLFFDYAMLYNIPVTFGCGIPVTNSNPAKLLKLYYRWMTDGNFGSRAFNDMINSEAFDREKLKKAVIGGSDDTDQQPSEPESDKTGVPGDDSKQPCKEEAAAPDSDSEQPDPAHESPAREDKEKGKKFYKPFISVIAGLRLTNDPRINKKRLDDFKAAAADELRILGGNSKDAEYLEIKNSPEFQDYLGSLAAELALPPEEFLSKYTRLRTGKRQENGADGDSKKVRGNDSEKAACKDAKEELLKALDTSALKTIKDMLKEERGMSEDQNNWQLTDAGVRNILASTVCRQQSAPGKLHVTGIDAAVCTLRDDLYIAGLSASKFPGKPVEDYLLLDCDLERFEDQFNGQSDEDAGGAAEADKSDSDITYIESLRADDVIERKKKQLISLVKLASELGSDIHLSYPGMNVSELKKDNPSSVIDELYKMQEKDGDSSFRYFGPELSASRLIGQAYVDGKGIKRQVLNEAEQTEGGTGDKCAALRRNWGLFKKSEEKDRKYSPSTISDFVKCQKRFMLKELLEIHEPDDENLLEVISPKDKGTLAHSLMEKLVNSGMQPDDFKNLSSEYFDRYIKEHPPLIPGKMDEEEKLFVEMMGKAYDMTDPEADVVLKEEDVRTEISGVKIHGFPDRVEKLEDDTCRIVDFKTGNHIEPVPDDLETCLQVLIYAYILENNDADSGKTYRVSDGEYRYLKQKETIRCKYDLDMKEKLQKKLEDFVTDLGKNLENAVFSVADSKKQKDGICKYCKFGDVCGKDETEEQGEEQND